MSRCVAATLMPIALLLAAAAPPPGAETDDPLARAAYRNQGVTACRRELATPSMNEAQATGFCRCVFDTYMQSVPLRALPALGSPAFQESIQPATNYCVLALPPAQAAEMQQRLYNVRPADPGAARQVPAELSDAAIEAAREPGLVEQLQDYIESAPLWAWGGIGLLVLALLLRKLFRRGDSNDLIGPPPGMRQSGPVRPRETDRL